MTRLLGSKRADTFAQMRLSHAIVLVLGLGLMTGFTCAPSTPAEPAPAEPDPQDDVVAKMEEFRAANFPVDAIATWAHELQYSTGDHHPINDPRTWPKAWAAVDQMFEEARQANPAPEDRMRLYIAQAEVHDTADFSETDDMVTAALEAYPGGAVFEYVDKSGRSRPQELKLEVCNKVGPQVLAGDPEVDRVEFLEDCWIWANRDVSKLTFEGAEKAIAGLEAEKKRQQKFFNALATYFPGGGFCKGSCMDAWTDLGRQEVITKCVERCYDIGWESNTPDGVVNTRCIDSDCEKNGWESKGDGGKWVAKCIDGDCNNGWTLKGKKGKYTLTCHEGGCLKDGYDVKTPEGGNWSCNCAKDCFQSGTRCKPIE